MSNGSSKKSKSCFCRRSGGSLTFYLSKSEALIAAERVYHFKRLRLCPYRCQECLNWHLAPKDRIDNSWLSTCKDPRGQRKRAYPTHDDAVRRAGLILSERGIFVQPYHCRKCGEWHLTKGGQ